MGAQMASQVRQSCQHFLKNPEITAEHHVIITLIDEYENHIFASLMSFVHTAADSFTFG